MLVWTLVKPQRAETLRSVRIKEGLFVFVLCFFLGTLIPATVSSSPVSVHVTSRRS